VLEIACKARGFKVMFLPKYYCELSFIEQCLGHSKQVYRQYPVSKKEEDLEKNLISVLESVPMATMQQWVSFTMVHPHGIWGLWNLISLINRYAQQSCKFMHAYYHGLNGKQAAWASKKYRGHRVLPESLMNDLEKAAISL
jgi:hypothetical protein